MMKNNRKKYKGGFDRSCGSLQKLNRIHMCAFACVHSSTQRDLFYVHLIILQWGARFDIYVHDCVTCVKLIHFYDSPPRVIKDILLPCFI